MDTRNADPVGRGLLKVDARTWWEDIRVEILESPANNFEKQNALEALGQRPAEGIKIWLNRTGLEVTAPGVEIDPDEIEPAVQSNNIDVISREDSLLVGKSADGYHY